jgi:hypothetical protein
MNKILPAILSLILCQGLFAQWSSDPANPNQIYSQTSAQVMPKTAITADGHTWIAWLDNSTGNYNTYLQRLDFLGVPEFATPLLVSNHTTASWTTDWSMDCDPSGNAILCFQDFRLGPNNVVIYKISPGGLFLWGADGIMLSSETGTGYDNWVPTVLCLSGGRTVAAWQRSGTSILANDIVLQSLTSDGVFEWGPAGLILTSTTVRYNWPQLRESTDGNVLVKYYEDTGSGLYPTRHILVQKYSPTGNALWANPTVVQNLGGISAWNQVIGIASDNAGGILLTWHDNHLNGNIANSYVQHVTVDGAVTMPANGAAVSTETGYNQFYPRINYDPVLQEVYVFWKHMDGNQEMSGLQLQKLSLNGDRLWTDTGAAYIPLGSYPISPLRVCRMDSAMVFLYAISPTANNDQLANLKAYAVDSNGQAIWAPTAGMIASTTTLKMHYDQDNYQDEWGVVIWEDGNGPSFTYAMRFNSDGTAGTIYPTPYNLTAQVVNENDVILNWEMSEVFVPPLGYNIYRNNVFYMLVSPSAVPYTISDLGPGQWTFKVSALFEGGQESAFSNSAVINITGDGSEITPAVELTLQTSPNPCRTGAKISVKGIKSSDRTSISIYTIRGQLVRQTCLSGKPDFDWNWDGRDEGQHIVGSGIYIILVESGAHRLQEKLLKY